MKKDPSANQTAAEHIPETSSCFLWSLMKRKAGTLTNMLEGLVMRRHKKCSNATNSMVLIDFPKYAVYWDRGKGVRGSISAHSSFQHA